MCAFTKSLFCIITSPNVSFFNVLVQLNAVNLHVDHVDDATPTCGACSSGNLEHSDPHLSLRHGASVNSGDGNVNSLHEAVLRSENIYT